MSAIPPRLAEKLFHLSAEMLCVADLSGRFVYVNPSFELVLGYRSEALLSRPFLELVHPEDRAATLAALEAMGHGATVANFVNRYICANGQVRHLSWMAVPSPEDDLVYATARDVTGSVLAEEALRQATREAQSAVHLKAAILSNLGHELRTPLNVIIGLVDLLGHTELDVEQREWLDLVAASGRTLLDMISNLLELARLDSGRATSRAQPTDLRGLVAVALSECGAAASCKGLSLREEIDASLPPLVELDAPRVQLVLRHLLDNAVRFTERGQVVVRVYARQPASEAAVAPSPAPLELGPPSTARLQWEILDSGPGFHASFLERAAEQFTQQDDSPSRRHGGLGLGLAIAERSVRLMGGTLRLANEPSGGCRVSFDLPLQPVQPATCEAGRSPLSTL